jgi:hypothetical protein
MRGSVVVASVETLESLVDGPIAESGGKWVGFQHLDYTRIHATICRVEWMIILGICSEGTQSMQRVQACLHTQCGPCHRGFKYHC